MARSLEELLRPSNLHKVLACPASAGREAEVPRTTSTYAEEGIGAHEFAAIALKQRVPAASLVGQRASNGVECTPDMAEHVQWYVDYVNALCAQYSVEPAVELDIDLLMLDKHGTTDAVVLGDRDLHVIDFKFGQGVPVAAENNPQLMAYAQGLIDRWEPLIEDLETLTVHLHIVQPRATRAPNVWQTSWRELMQFETHVRRVLAVARGPEPPYVAGEHCRFCAVKRQCDTFRESVPRIVEATTVTAGEPLTNVNPEAVAFALANVPLVKLWLSTIEDYGFRLLAEGVDVPGYKLVAGRRARVWGDEKLFLAHVRRKRLPLDVWNPRVLTSVAGLEKELGKKRFVEMEFPTLVTTKDGKPTVVPTHDPRPALQLNIAGPDSFATDDDDLLSS